MANYERPPYNPDDHIPPMPPKPPVPPYGTYDMYGRHHHRPHEKPKNHMAHFTPHLLHYHIPDHFKFWCNKIIPLVYDDSLSYMELLNKIVMYLNGMLEDEKLVAVNMEELCRAYHDLEHFVNDYFAYYQSKGIINYDVAVTNNNYLEILPDCDTAQMNTVYRLKFVEDSEQRIPDNLPEQAIPFSGAECVLFNLSNFILKRIGGEWQEIPENGKQAILTNNYQFLITDRDIYFREHNGDTWEAWQSIFGNWWNVEWEKVKQYIDDGDESVRATIAEAVAGVRSELNAEIARATAAENVLDQKITAETSRATAAENEIRNDLESETDTREEQYTELSNAISAETTRATGVENTLSSLISGEVTRATTAENELSARITTEVGRATTAENNLSERITTEVARATAAENALSARIQDWETDLADEREDRQQADNNLQSQINTINAKDIQQDGRMQSIEQGYIPNGGNNVTGGLNIQRDDDVEINSTGQVTISSDGGGVIISDPNSDVEITGDRVVISAHNDTVDISTNDDVNVSTNAMYYHKQGEPETVYDEVARLKDVNSAVATISNGYIPNGGNDVTGGLNIVRDNDIILNGFGISIEADTDDLNLTATNLVYINGDSVSIESAASSLSISSSDDLNIEGNDVDISSTTGDVYIYTGNNGIITITSGDVDITANNNKIELTAENTIILDSPLNKIQGGTNQLTGISNVISSTGQNTAVVVQASNGQIFESGKSIARSSADRMVDTCGGYTLNVSATDSGSNPVDVSMLYDSSSFLYVDGTETNVQHKNVGLSMKNADGKIYYFKSNAEVQAITADMELVRKDDLAGVTTGYIPNTGNNESGTFTLRRDTINLRTGSAGGINLQDNAVNITSNIANKDITLKTTSGDVILQTTSANGDVLISPHDDVKITTSKYTGNIHTILNIRGDLNSLSSTTSSRTGHVTKIPDEVYNVEILLTENFTLPDGAYVCVPPNGSTMRGDGNISTSATISGSSDVLGFKTDTQYGDYRFENIGVNFGSDAFVFDNGTVGGQTYVIKNCYISAERLFNNTLNGNLILDGCYIVGNVNISEQANATISNCYISGEIVVDGSATDYNPKLAIISSCVVTGGVTGAGANNVRKINVSNS